MDWYAYEKQAKAEGYDLICGIDEAGRGPLAGPVFAAAVILPPGLAIEGLNDSKKISPQKRERLFVEIQQQAVDFSIGMATVEEIDEINILQAVFRAMNRALEGLHTKPQLALVDGNQLPSMAIPVRGIIKGDASSASIAAASILAKVSRDHLMQEWDEVYPQYKLAKHKGYGTQLHYEMLDTYGISPIHRKTFLKKYCASRGLVL